MDDVLPGNPGYMFPSNLLVLVILSTKLPKQFYVQFPS